MIGTITHILSKAGYKSMNGPLADERRRLSAAVSPAAYVSYDPRLLAGAGWYGYRISFKGGDRSMLERARYLLGDYYLVREMYDNYADGIYSLGVLLRQRVPHYGIGGGQQQEPDALNFTMPNGGTVTLTRNGSPTVVELEYSVDQGRTWQIWEEVGTVRSLTLAAGETMYVRNTSETSTGFSTGYDGTPRDYYIFSLSNTTHAGGPVESLICKNPQNAVHIYRATFRSLFYNNSYLITPPDIISTSISYRALQDTFNNCNNMIKAPTLLFTSVYAYGCYRMFYGCSLIDKIVVYFTTIGTSGLNNWVNGVAPTGDFYCPSTLTIPTGASGIPTGWTRHDI